jgi:hypothetical protein
MSNTKNWIAYVGPFSFPWGQACSRRVCGIARSLSESGNSIVICSGDAKPLTLTDLNEGEEKSSITYIGVNETPPKDFSLLRKSLQIFFLWGKRTVNWLDSQPNKPSHVIVYGGSAQYMFRLLPWCKKNNIPLIVDIVEWYDPRQMNGGFFGPFHISENIAFHYYYPKCSGIIAISSYLEKHFLKKGLPVIRIPPTLDVENHPLFFSNKDELNPLLTLLYARTPG